MKRRWPARLALLVFGAATIAGLLAISGVYSAAGAGYAEYSSLRTDPKGAKVFYDALAKTGIVRVSRNYRELSELKGAGASVLVIGIQPWEMMSEPRSYFEELEKTAQGNRLVLALAPGNQAVPETKVTPAIETHWGIRLKKVKKDDEWTSPWVFDRSPGWTVVLREDGNPIGVEKAFGSGSIMLFAHSKMFTNRAMVAARETTVLSTIVGPHTRVVFDESHLGIRETGSVVGLARKYRLQGLIWGFALLAAIFIWKSAEPFPPPPVDDVGRPPVAGLDSQAGFLRLLERHIAPTRLIEECVREWRLTSPKKDIAPAIPAGDPAGVYRAIQQELTSHE